LSADERLSRLARAWTEAADGYEAYFVPRFSPWVVAAVDAVTVAGLPEGPVLVPCCGTFPEADLLVGRFPDRTIEGIDLSAGMVRRARERVAGWPRVSVREADASTLAPEWTDRCAAVVSVFGLQQLPEPDLAIRSWAAALRPGGRLSVVYWSGVTEEDGPFALAASILHGRLPAVDSSWEGRLETALVTRCAVVERDEELAYPMAHDSALSFIDAYIHSGPLRSLAIARGEAFVEEVRAEFLRRAPAGEWRHRPRARLLVAHR
jgi:SAM-dependent methyltransferase